MAASIGKFAAGKFMSKKAKDDQAHRLEDGRDPYWYLETDKHGRTKKRPKKSAKHYPSYIPLEDRERINKFRSYAKLMDTAFFGQAGMSFFVGLVPVAGDFADGGISWLLVQRYANTISCGLPKSVYARMMSNITIDIAIGFVPVLGDIADAVYKANIRNLVLLEDYLKQAFAPKSEQPMRQIGRDDGIRQHDGAGTGAPAATTTTTKDDRKTGGGFFGGGGRKDRERDVEMGPTRDSHPTRADEAQETGTVHGARR